MRGDMEILGYNLVLWSSGSIPWEKERYEIEIQQSKRKFLDDLESMYGLFRYEQLGKQIHYKYTHFNLVRDVT